jgi:hypothetical protein
MNYWRINTDSDARHDVRTCDLWYKFGMVLTGDYIEGTRRHDAVFLKLSPGDGVFMHHSGMGVVGFGIVKGKWDKKTFQGSERFLYVREVYEHRIAVDWELSCDCRKRPLPINGVLPHMGTYCVVNPKKWKIQSVLDELRKRAEKD